MVTKEVAWSFLKQYGINSFRINVGNVLDIVEMHDNWIAMSYQSGRDFIEKMGVENQIAESKALTLVYKSPTEKKLQYAILYKDELPYNEKVFVLLHEIGHILLKHTYTGAILGKSNDESKTNEQEREADIFACEVMAPSCVLKNKLGVNTAEGIQEITMIPPEAATEYAGEMHKRKNDISNSKIAKSLYEQYDDFVAETKKESIKGKVKDVFHRPLTYITIIALLIIISVFSFSALTSDLKLQLQESADKITQLETDYKKSVNTINQLQDSNEDVKNKYSELQNENELLKDQLEAITAGTDDIPPAPSADPGNQKKVYATKEGAHYHTKDCYYILGKTSKEITLEEAKAERLTPCLVCHPDK